MTVFNPANQNPWYVLMTLHGDPVTAKSADVCTRNKDAWNDWIILNASNAQRRILERHEYFLREEVDEREAIDTLSNMHREEMIKRNGEGFEYPGLPDLRKELELSDIKNDSLNLIMDGYIFLTGFAIRRCRIGFISFNNVHFFSSLELEKLRLLSSLSFSDTEFDSSLIIRDSVIEGDFEFDGTKIKGEVRFDKLSLSEHLIVKNSEFTSNFYYVSGLIKRSIRFGESSFLGRTLIGENVIISDGTQISDSTFLDEFKFDAECGGRSTFSQLTFEKRFVFYEARFRGGVAFFRVNFKDRASFSYAIFNAGVEFGYCFFEDVALFDETTFDYKQAPANTYGAMFSDCQFSRPVNFRNAKFFDKYPVFSGTNLPEQSVFSIGDEHWPSRVEERDFEYALKTCTTLRHLMNKQAAPEDEHFFFRREMEIIRNSSSGLRRIPYDGYKYFSAYGSSIARPVAAIIILWFIGFLVFLDYFSTNLITINHFATFKELKGAASFSFSNIFPIFGFRRLYFGPEFLENLPDYVKFFAAMQTVFSLPLLFLFGLGVRQRFRLR